jgi:hypothetical protein
MQKLDFDLIEDGDSLLILGTAGEDGIIAYTIGRQWTNITLHRYGSPDILDSSAYTSDEPNYQLEARVSGPFTQKVQRKSGHVHVTLKSYGSDLNVTQSDIDVFDWIIKVCSCESDNKNCYFAPFVLHRKI